MTAHTFCDKARAVPGSGGKGSGLDAHTMQFPLRLCSQQTRAEPVPTSGLSVAAEAAGTPGV